MKISQLDSSHFLFWRKSFWGSEFLAVEVNSLLEFRVLLLFLFFCSNLLLSWISGFLSFA